MQIAQASSTLAIQSEEQQPKNKNTSGLEDNNSSSTNTSFHSTCSLKNVEGDSTPLATATTATDATATEQMRMTMTYTGLSELAKQLRILQSKNEFQGSEIERLERQLRIMSELQGVSVSDLRSKLESACQQEAHNELLNQISSLKAQLETMKLKESNQKQSLTNMDEQSKSREIANLQLRVGELEEIDQTIRKEMQALYKRLSEQTVKATTAESGKKELENQVNKYRDNARTDKQDLENVTNEKNQYLEEKEDLARQLRELQLELKLEKEKNGSLTSQLELQSKLSSENEQQIEALEQETNEIIQKLNEESSSSKQNKKTGKLRKEIASLYEKLRDSESKATKLEATIEELQSELTKLKKQCETEQEQQKQLQTNYDFIVEEHNQLYEKLCDIELQLSIEKDNAHNLEGQIFAHQKDMALQKEQYNSRFTLQQEQIVDMKQQMASLYTACNLLEEDCTEQRDRRLTLNDRLGEADMSIARQFDESGASSGRERAVNATTATMIDNSDTTTIATTATNANAYSNYSLDYHPDQQGAIVPLSVEPVPTLNYSLPPGFARSASPTPRHYGNDDYSAYTYESRDRRGSSSRSLSVPNMNYYDDYDWDGNGTSYQHVHRHRRSHRSRREEQLPTCLMEGYMYKYDKNRFKGWKKRYFKLAAIPGSTSTGEYQLGYSNGPHEKMKGFIPLTMGISCISETAEFHAIHPNQHMPSEHIIALVVDPCDTADNGQPRILFLATKMQDSLHEWIHAINVVTEFKSTAEQQEAIDHLMAIRMQMQMSG